MDEQIAEVASQSSEQLSSASRDKLQKSLELFLKLPVSGVEVKGIEHLDDVKKGVIFAVNHDRDINIPASAYGLLKNTDRTVVMTHISSQDMKNDAPTFVSLKLAGDENFLPIHYHGVKVDNEWRPGMVQKEDYERIADAAADGKDVIVASENPANTGQNKRPGLAPVLSAQQMLHDGKEGIVVPVAVAMDAHERVGNAGIRAILETIIRRKPSVMHIGNPMTLDKINMVPFYEVLDKRKRGEKVTEEELNTFRSVKEQLQAQAQSIVDVQQQLLGKTTLSDPENHS